MNRIKLGPLATAELATHNKSVPATELRPIQKTVSTSPNFFVPMHYQPRYAYPLIVWLHSDEERNQVLRVMPEISLRNYIGVGPESGTGIHENGTTWPQSKQGIDEAIRTVCDAIDDAKANYHINSDRIFLAGYGAGGTMALRIGLENPELVSGVVSLNGALPTGWAPLRDWMRCREIPVFWGHCRNSSDFEEELLCRQLRLLHVAGFSVTLRQYPNGDELPVQMLADLDRWIMEMIESACL